MSALDMLNRVLDPIRSRISNMIARAVVNLVDDSLKIQALQLEVLVGETRDGIERFQQYGFTSVPLAGAEAAVLFVGGRRDNGIAVAVDDRRYRLKDLADGEVALYNKFGAKVLLKADGSIEVTPKSGASIVLNGGGAKVARVGDATSGHTHDISMLAAPAGTAGGPITGTLGSSTDTIAQGADKVLA